MPRIRTTYTEIWWPDPEGEYEEEHGWVDEEGVEIEADDLNEESLVDAAVKFLRRAGTTDPSSSAWHKGIWYHWPDSEQDYRTGRNREEACHLEGFTEAQEREIFNEIAPKWCTRG